MLYNNGSNLYFHFDFRINLVVRIELIAITDRGFVEDK